MEKTEALEFIRARLDEGCLRSEVINELLEANVSRATAYRWFNMLAKPEAEPRLRVLTPLPSQNSNESDESSCCL